MDEYNYKNPKAKALSQEYNQGWDSQFSQAPTAPYSGIPYSNAANAIAPDWNTLNWGVPATPDYPYAAATSPLTAGNVPSELPSNFGAGNLGYNLGGFGKVNPKTNIPSLLDGSPNAGLTSDIPGAFGGTGTPNVTPPSAWDTLFDTKGTGGMILGLGNLGISGFNAWMGKKNQNFLQDYYGKQQTMQANEFRNSAKDANRQLSERAWQGAKNKGLDPDSDAGKAYTSEYLSKWGVNEKPW